MNIELYPHNQETYNKIQEMWKTVNRVATIQATGTGKSFLILKCLFDIPNKSKVVLAPTEYIFNQLVNNSKEVIPNVQFITYSKLAFMTDEEIQSLNPSLIVLDEFHRCGAEQWGKGVQKLLDSFPNSKVLGTSATPIRFLDNERDMSDEIFEGNIAVNLSLAEAIVKGILPMPKYISALYTFEEEAKNLIHKVINSKNTEEEKEELIKQIEAMKNQLNKSKGIPKILQKHLTQSNDKFIIFCKDKNHLNEMKEVVVNWFKKANISNKIETYTVYTGYENTNIEFQNFRDNKNESLKLLFSIEMLNEGVHVENITGVILLRSTISPIIYYQQIGRAIDAGNKNEPLIFDFVNNFDNIGAKKFVSDLKEFRKREINKRNESGKNDSDDVDISEFIVFDEVLDVKELFNNIENQLIDNWDVMYKKIEKFYLENGHTNIPRSYKRLATWVHTQRQFYDKDLLNNKKIEMLEKLNFSWNLRELNFNNMYNLLEEYVSEYGDCLVNLNEEYKGKKLGSWINSIRNAKVKGNLSKKRISLLENIGFIWNVNDYKWINNYNNLLKYLKLNNKYPDKNYKSLYSWITYQKQEYKKGNLSLDKINKLKKIKFPFEIKIKESKNLTWMEFYEKYKQTGMISKSYDDKELYNWQQTNRYSYKSGHLSKEKINLLNEINFIWRY